MKYAASICIYNDWRMIAACIRQFPLWVEKILILHTAHPWFGAPSDEAHRVLDEINKLNDPRVEYVELSWNKEDDQRNWGLGRLYDYDFVFTLDADEFFTPEDWEILRDHVKHENSFSYVPERVVTYWKTWDYAWTPEDSHKPVIAVHVKKTVFSDKRSEVSQLLRKVPVTMHHLSWVRTDKNVAQKVQNYMHAGDFDAGEWLRTIWAKWTPEDITLSLRPYGIEGKTVAVYAPVPDSIKKYFNENPLSVV